MLPPVPTGPERLDRDGHKRPWKRAVVSPRTSRTNLHLRENLSLSARSDCVAVCLRQIVHAQSIEIAAAGTSDAPRRAPSTLRGCIVNLPPMERGPPGSLSIG